MDSNNLNKKNKNKNHRKNHKKNLFNYLCRYQTMKLLHKYFNKEGNLDI